MPNPRSAPDAKPPAPGGPDVVVIGAGPAGLAAAEVAATAGLKVEIHDAMASPARKFLLAGRGGLNLTHSEPLEAFLSRYGEARERLEPAIRAFPPTALREWAAGLGIETFVGSSGRIFPVAMKASPLLRAWLRRLDEMGVDLRTRSRWVGWGAHSLAFETPDGLLAVAPRAALFALGGASWPRLGSDGAWAPAFRERGVHVAPFAPTNCGFEVPWSDLFRTTWAGSPVKAARFSFDGMAVRGEAVVTKDGIEGGAIYALSPRIRGALSAGRAAELQIDLAPDLELDTLVRRLAARPGESSSANRLRRASVSKLAASLIRESAEGPQLPSEAAALAARIKQLRLKILAPFAIARAISSAGGVAWADVREDYSLVDLPSTFVCGEMLDWEAPTGGYLLQACIATGRAAGAGIAASLSS